MAKAKVHTDPICNHIQQAIKSLEKINATPKRRWKYANAEARKVLKECRKNGKGYVIKGRHLVSPMLMFDKVYAVYHF